VKTVVPQDRQAGTGAGRAVRIDADRAARSSAMHAVESHDMAGARAINTVEPGRMNRRCRRRSKLCRRLVCAPRIVAEEGDIAGDRSARAPKKKKTELTKMAPP